VGMRFLRLAANTFFAWYLISAFVENLERSGNEKWDRRIIRSGKQNDSIVPFTVFQN